MFRSLLFAAVVSLSLVTCGATESFAQSSPQFLKPQPQLKQLKQYGLLVTQVFPGTTAAMQGLEAGDVISVSMASLSGALPTCTTGSAALAGWPI